MKKCYPEKKEGTLSIWPTANDLFGGDGQMTDIFRCCEDAVLLASSGGCSVYQLHNETGEGVMTIYEVFPGVTLSYNDFHMQYYDSRFRPDREVFCIDHCREGRLEYTSKHDAYSYVEAGDLKLDQRMTHEGRFVLPLSHYHGITITFDFKTACRTMPEQVKDFPVDLRDIRKKFCRDKWPVVLHGESAIEHIFSELYAVPQKIRLPYFKIKILELLLFLEALELPLTAEEKPYFYKGQVEAVKAVQQFLAEHMSEDFSQDELAERFGISQTVMKKCFKSVFGTTIGHGSRSTG